MTRPPQRRAEGEPAVSIVIPVRNGAATLEPVLAAIADQEADFAHEIVAIDSGSTDGSLELLRGKVDRLVEIPPETFDHGLTRNRGIEIARGEFVVLLVQDAVPASRDWLSALTAPLFADARVAGCYARQLPRPDASRIARHALARWFAAEAEPHTSVLESAEAFAALTPSERHRMCTFDNVCSCLRRSVWQRHPFRATAIAEDLAWAKEVLLAGWKLSFVPEAAVVHSHDRSLGYEFRRSYQVHHRLFELFGLHLVPSLGSLPGAIRWGLRDHARCLRYGDGPRPDAREILRALGLAFVWPLGQYLGARAAARPSPRRTGLEP